MGGTSMSEHRTAQEARIADRGRYADGRTRQIAVADDDGTPLLIIEPITVGALEWQPADNSADSPIRLSRFAYLHRDGADMVLSTPRSRVTAVIRDERVAAFIAGLGVARRPTTLAALSRLSAEACLRLADALRAVHLVTGAEPDCEEDDTIPQTWEFHDLLVHERSRRPRSARSMNLPVSASFPNIRSPNGTSKQASWRCLQSTFAR